MQNDTNYTKNVFINCPFDSEYFNLLKPLVFTITYFGFEPRIALESSDSGNARLEKIISLIKASKYSIHDLSRLRSKKIDDYYRLNMPFELGIDYGLRKFDKNYSSKKSLILEKDKYEYMKAISDINGFDIKNHGNDIEELIECLRSWFSETVGLRNLKSSLKIVTDYFHFMRYQFDQKVLKYEDESSTLAEEYARHEIKNLTIPELITDIKEWISL